MDQNYEMLLQALQQYTKYKFVCNLTSQPKMRKVKKFWKKIFTCKCVIATFIIGGAVMPPMYMKIIQMHINLQKNYYKVILILNSYYTKKITILVAAAAGVAAFFSF